ncbi:hypothetical protein PVC01_120039500 [Plasmodium vivax]|uniref:(malaria parasite P. vivax) hypothetical protein n=1 Tax=Plasmodium vivax TaxID=5855 RepID=A0A1G4HGZ4_PLAVI|nr:unnamed protein product [Plasmodium vivax]CAI7722171.1 hypothetical protein PVPAM_120040900 [Plasmodium vivax]SCO68738.1 hypothetical protein PVT01_120040000 [Plasmodium vivax]SCO74201.1 hypothetical protein PVC01_120039500 [Plasmodium vivax]
MISVKFALILFMMMFMFVPFIPFLMHKWSLNRNNVIFALLAILMTIPFSIIATYSYERINNEDMYDSKDD